MPESVTEPARQTPVSHSVDVVVAGGGTAGVAAAVVAARLGLSVAMVERTSMPGGMVTHVTSWLNDFETKGGFPREFLEHLQGSGACTWPYYNPFLVVPYLDDLLRGEGVRFLYLVQVAAPLIVDGKLGGVIVESKQGRTAIRAKIVIDATGDGDVAARAGAQFEMGRASDGASQAISLSHLYMNYGGGTTPAVEVNEIVHQAARDAGRRYTLPYDKWTVRLVPGTAGCVWQGVPHVTGHDPLSADGLSDALVSLRDQAREMFSLLKEHTDRFAGIEFGPFSAIPGVRESRRITGDEGICEDDVLAGRRREDGLFLVTQSIDIHRCREGEPAIIVRKVKPYHVPYGALLPKGVENLLVAGRCISGDHEALSSYRIIADCMAMGEAAAIAACMAIEGGSGVREVSPGDVRAEMVSRGYA